MTNSEWHLFVVKFVDGSKFVLSSQKRELEIMVRAAGTEGGVIQKLHVASVADSDGTNLHISDKEIIYYNPEKKLASFSLERLREASAN